MHESSAQPKEWGDVPGSFLMSTAASFSSSGKKLPNKETQESDTTIADAVMESMWSSAKSRKVDGRAFAAVVKGTPKAKESKSLPSLAAIQLSQQRVVFETPKDKEIPQRSLKKKAGAKAIQANQQNAEAKLAHLLQMVASSSSSTSKAEVFANILSTLEINDNSAKDNVASTSSDSNGSNDDDEIVSDFEEPPTPFTSTQKHKSRQHIKDKTKDVKASLFNDDKQLTNQEDKSVVNAHGFKWYQDKDGLAKAGIANPVGLHHWRLKSQYDPMITVMAGSNRDKRLEPFDIFMMLLPHNVLKDIVKYTNQRLASLNEAKAPTTEGEILKFFGILILGTFVEFDNWKDLWTKKSDSKYVSAPNFAKTGFMRDCFLTLFVNIRYAYQPSKKPQSMTHKTYQWLLLNGHIEGFNAHRAKFFIPGSRIVLDKFFARWYGLGGHYINIGLPMYVELDRKPEDGCEIQCSADGVIGVMCQLKVFKSSEENDRLKRLFPKPWYREDIHHGGQVLLNLVLPWLGTNRLVGGDSYFASVLVANELEEVYNMGFVGSVKTATKGFPQSYLSSVVKDGNRGNSEVLLNRDAETGIPKMMAIMTVDRNRNYYVATRGSTAPKAVSRI